MPMSIGFSEQADISVDRTPAQAQLLQRLQPVLERAAALADRPRLLIAVDGPCGSGKTTLAALLCQALACPCVHMDDFHVPHARKTAQRLAQPGGNSDRERLMTEVLLPWREDGTAVYRPYDCQQDALAEAVALPLIRHLVLEGSYSHHPELAALTDVQVFIRVSREEQLRRLSQRCGARLQQFVDRWIPLEDRYFAAFSLPRREALVIENHSVQGV